MSDSSNKGSPGSKWSETPCSRILNGMKGVVTLGQDPTQLNFCLVEGIKEKLTLRHSGIYLYASRGSL